MRMFNTVKRIAVGLAALSISVGAFAQSDRAMDLDALLQLEEGQFAQSLQNKQRERDLSARQSKIAFFAKLVRSATRCLRNLKSWNSVRRNEFKLADLTVH